MSVNRCGSRGAGAWAPPLTPNFEAQFFAAATTPLRDVGKILLAPPPLTQILDPHLIRYLHLLLWGLRYHKYL